MRLCRSQRLQRTERRMEQSEESLVALMQKPKASANRKANGAKRREFSCAYAEVKGFSEPKGEWSKAKRV
ncbi:hypothetical protein BUY35_04525 [Staphylococcus cohnii]|nr:hypothetical protein BUY39_01605 [Staphylococcus cohnii]RIM31114.1 hypothetical protein BUY35_04525 [Staphylococcus cohnii]